MTSENPHSIENRYVVEAIDGTNDEIHIIFRGRMVKGRYRYNPKAKQATLLELTTDSPALARENRLHQYVGKGPLNNARRRATEYFKEREQAAKKQTRAA